jgi:hypothetical protein
MLSSTELVHRRADSSSYCPESNVKSLGYRRCSSRTPASLKQLQRAFYSTIFLQLFAFVQGRFFVLLPRHGVALVK